MKARYGSLILMVVMTLTAFTTPTLSETSNQANALAASSTNNTIFVLPTNEMTEWCTVVLDNPRSSLNVRDSRGKVVGKLPYGASVYVDAYDGGFARVSVKRRGRLVTIGWVASEYLSC